MIINFRGRRTVKRDSPIVFESVLERRKHPDVFVCNESAFGCKLQFLLNKQTKVQFVSRRSSLTSFRFDIQQEPAEILFHWRDVLSSLRSQMKGSWKWQKVCGIEFHPTTVAEIPSKRIEKTRQEEKMDGNRNCNETNYLKCLINFLLRQNKKCWLFFKWPIYFLETCGWVLLSVDFSLNNHTSWSVVGWINCGTKIKMFLIRMRLASTTANIYTWKYKSLPFPSLSFVVYMFTFTLVRATQLTSSCFSYPI